MLKGFYVAEPSNEDTIPADAINLLDSRRYGVTKISGLGRPSADLQTSELGGVDASYYSGMSIKSRSITLEMNTQNDLQRMALYQAIPYNTKRRFYADMDTGTFWIDGYAKELDGDMKSSPIVGVELPVFCPYPWFRSIRPHEQVITPFFRSDSYADVTLSSDELHHLSQDGDIDAGIMIFVEELSDPGTASYYGDLTGLYDSAGNYIKVSPVWGIDTSGHIDYSGGETKVLDTTPGEMWWAELMSTTGGKLLPSSVDFNGSAITVAPQTGIDIGFAFRNYVDLRSNYTVTARWYDTWSGI